MNSSSGYIISSKIESKNNKIKGVNQIYSLNSDKICGKKQRFSFNNNNGEITDFKLINGKQKCKGLTIKQILKSLEGLQKIMTE